MYEPQYRYIAANKEKYAKYAREYYHRTSKNPEKVAARKAARALWVEANRSKLLEKQRQKKRERKQWAIELLGGCCAKCQQKFHPAVYEFHHLDPTTKDKDPSKMLSLSLERLQKELEKCELLCANCHRLVHHEGGYAV